MDSPVASWTGSVACLGDLDLSELEAVDDLLVNADATSVLERVPASMRCVKMLCKSCVVS